MSNSRLATQIFSLDTNNGGTPGTFNGITYISHTSPSSSWVVPLGVTEIILTACGGGAGAGAGATAVSLGGATGGGGGGAAITSTINLSVSSGNIINFTIGGGGTGGISSTGGGGQNGTSGINTVVTSSNILTFMGGGNGWGGIIGFVSAYCFGGTTDNIANLNISPVAGTESFATYEKPGHGGLSGFTLAVSVASNGCSFGINNAAGAFGNSSNPVFGGGGGGSSNNIHSTGGNGGSSYSTGGNGTFGGGGGGGGGGFSPTPSGAGGNGGAGFVQISWVG